jgi:hypothetical protein
MMRVDAFIICILFFEAGLRLVLYCGGSRVKVISVIFFKI